MRCSELATICNGTLYNTAAANSLIKGVSIDSRTIVPGQLFIAIRGAYQDGHNYINQAIANGAAGLISEFDYPGLAQIPGTVPFITVRDSHRAMIQLATEYRQTTGTHIIAVTGSNGKTTTKEYIFSMLEQLDPDTYKSPGNLNNLFGVPLSIFNMPVNCRHAVYELGISTINEMPELAKIVKPNSVLITNVGPSHIEFLHSVKEVARAKLTLITNSNPDTKLIINGDDSVLVEEAQKCKNNFVTFALDNEASYKPDLIEKDDLGYTLIRIEGNNFKLPLSGKHQLYNLLAAYAAVRESGYSFEQIRTEDIYFETAPMRGQSEHYDGISFLVDCYNANPASMTASLQAFADSVDSEQRSIAILGDMLELGTESETYHRELAGDIHSTKPDLVILVGKATRVTADELFAKGWSPQNVLHFTNTQELQQVIKNILRENDAVLVKGSRGIALEAIIETYKPKRKGN